MKKIILALIGLLIITTTFGQKKGNKQQPNIWDLREKYIGMEFVKKGVYNYETIWECSDVVSKKEYSKYTGVYYIYYFYLTNGSETFKTRVYKSAEDLMGEYAFSSIFEQYGSPVEIITLSTANKWEEKYDYYKYIMRGDITEGMSTIEVMISIGRPSHQNTSSTGHQTWVYGSSKYLHFKDYILQSWSTYN